MSDTKFYQRSGGVDVPSKPRWWTGLSDTDIANPPEDVIRHVFSVLEKRVAWDAIRSYDGPVYGLHEHSVLQGTVRDALHAFLKEREAFPVILKAMGPVHRDIHAWSDGVIMLAYSEPIGEIAAIEIMLGTRRKDDLDRVRKLLEEFEPPAGEPVKNEHPGHAFMMIRDRYGEIELQPLGVSGHPLERSNYSDDVLGKYDRITRDLRSDDPVGRLSIIEGPPGTGKTRMIRGLMHECPDSKFVVMPPHLISELVDPNLLTTVVRERFSNELQGPLVLVLEDADQCLTERRAESMGAISSVLNLSDGIVGSLFDLRIVATTNAESSIFDQALLRHGRLSANVAIGPLSPIGAMKVWDRLVESEHPELRGIYPDKVKSREQTTLADIYTAVKLLT